MTRYDRVIRGGMIVDGSRFPRFRGDIGIKDGLIAEIGHIGAGEADETIDAGGLIVAPGFVDLHTHYDAQLFWDPYCTLSSWHGITTQGLFLLQRMHSRGEWRGTARAKA